MKKIIFSVISLFLIISGSYAQYQSFNWYVGADSYLNFGKKANLDNPVPSSEFTNLASSNNCSILSDSSGQVVIYIQDDTVFFPTTGDKILPISFCTYSPNQPFVIVGWQETNGDIQFEIFSLATLSATGYNLYYTNGTISGTTLSLTNSNSLIDLGLSSKMAVFRYTKTFVVTHELHTNKFRIYNDFPNTIYVTSNIGNIFGTYVGESFDDGFFKFSPSGNYLACTSPGQQDFKVYNFDKINGTLSNELSISSKNYNSIEFAAGNEEILYVSENKNIFQIQISNIDITSSINPIGTSTSYISNMQLAPDGKIYVAKSGDLFLGAINNPEILGDDCLYDDKQVGLNATSNGIIPAFPSNYFFNLPIVTWSPSSILFDTPVNFNLNYYVNNDSSYWDFGNGQYLKKSSNAFTQNIKKLGPTTIKYVLFFKHNLKNSWDSVVLSKKVVIKKPANTHFIYPLDTIICDTNQSVNIHIDYPDPNRKFNWTTNIGNLSYTNTLTDFTLHIPDDYYLQITDTLGNVLAYDTLVIRQYIPHFSEPSNNLFVINSNVDFEIQSQQIPEDFTNTSNLIYSWDFGDGNTNTGTGLNPVSNIYIATGDYSVGVIINGLANCSYNLTKNIHITNADTIIPGNHFLTPNVASICDTTKNNVLIEVPQTNYSFDIHWYYFSTELTGNFNKKELLTNKPGKYYVQIYDGVSFHAIDSAIINYNICQELNVTLSDNSVDATNCNQIDEIKFIADVQKTGNCDVDISKFYYYWDFGDNTYTEGTDLKTAVHKYLNPGIYVAQLFLMDEKDCEHIARKTVFIQQQTSDTIYLKAKQKDALGNYIFDFNSNGKLTQSFYDKSMFITTTSHQDFANFGETFTFDIQSPVDAKINKTSDITFFMNFALWGYFTANLTSPEGVTVDLASSMSSTKTLMFGFPGEDLLNYFYGKPKTYLFNQTGAEINDLGSGKTSLSYYTPDEKMVDGSFYFMPHNIYKFKSPDDLLGQSINGTWKLFIKGDSHYGRIVSWGLRFNPELFKRDLLPDYITCYDDEGNVYQTNDLVLKVTDLGGVNNQITCEIHYPNSNCTLKKTLLIEFSEIQNVLTPNGDGINDYWMPVSSTSQANIVVIDKVGRVVADFNASDNLLGWDGTFKGKPLPSDSYWYIIKLKNGIFLKGVLTIVR